MKVLVTGATGFVGSHLCDQLVRHGHEVYAQVRNPKKAQQFNLTATLVQGDLSRDSMEQWVKGLPVDLDCVIHTAGIVHAYRTQDFFTINTQATRDLFTLLTERIDQAHFIFVSSLAAHGPTDRGRGSEDRPVSLYGQSKKQAELELQELAAHSSWRLNIVRPPMVIGPRDPAVLDLFKMVQDKFVLYPGLQAGRKQYSIVAVFDLVTMITKLCEHPDLAGQTLYSAHPQVITYHQLVSTIAEQLPSKIIIIPIPMAIIKILALLLALVAKFLPVSARLTPDKIKEIEAQAWTCDGGPSEELLGMSYEWPLTNITRAAIDDYRQRGWLK